MPINVICSRCGGQGKLEFLQCDDDGHGIWEGEQCPACGGRGVVSELSFQERKAQQDALGVPAAGNEGVPHQ